jgi:hypothetical protein
MKSKKQIKELLTEEETREMFSMFHVDIESGMEYLCGLEKTIEGKRFYRLEDIQRFIYR